MSTGRIEVYAVVEVKVAEYPIDNVPVKGMLISDGMNIEKTLRETGLDDCAVCLAVTTAEYDKDDNEVRTDTLTVDPMRLRDILGR